MLRVRLGRFAFAREAMRGPVLRWGTRPAAARGRSRRAGRVADPDLGWTGRFPPNDGGVSLGQAAPIAAW